MSFGVISRAARAKRRECWNSGGILAIYPPVCRASDKDFAPGSHPSSGQCWAPQRCSGATATGSRHPYYVDHER